MDIKSAQLAPKGESRIAWAAAAMPALEVVRERFARERPLAGQRLSACLHVTAETGVLVRVLAAGGARVSLCASNPLTTQDDVAAALADHGDVEVFAVAGEDREIYFRHVHAVLERRPTLTIDDGADLVTTLHRERSDLLPGVIGGSEETTTGVVRLRSMAAAGALEYPVIAINNAGTKHLFDNRYGTGQSTIDGVLRATNRLFAGSVFVVCGYGWCGRGLAKRAAGLGARVLVTEVDPMRALEAIMEGYEVLPMGAAAERGDFFCTVTGTTAVIRRQHFEVMKDGAIICNAGHFDVEIDLEGLSELAGGRQGVRDGVEAFELADGRRIHLIAQGRLVNLAAAEGHPAEVMDLSFTNQALCAEYLTEHGKELAPGVHDVPTEIDARVAALKLSGMGVAIDTPTRQQTEYQASWQLGT